MEWMDGVKLSECSTEEIRDTTNDVQEALLKQLIKMGFFHADPHPGKHPEAQRADARGTHRGVDQLQPDGQH